MAESADDNLAGTPIPKDANFSPTPPKGLGWLSDYAGSSFSSHAHAELDRYEKSPQYWSSGCLKLDRYLEFRTGQSRGRQPCHLPFPKDSRLLFKLFSDLSYVLPRNCTCLA